MLRPCMFTHSRHRPHQLAPKVQAGECCRTLQRWREVRDLYKRAAEHYGEAGRGQAAAEALSKGARALEDVDPQVFSRDWSPPQPSNTLFLFVWLRRTKNDPGLGNNRAFGAACERMLMIGV